MFHMASCGQLPIESYQADLSVAVQQIFSCLFQFPQGVHESTLIGLLSTLCPEESVTLILNHLLRKDYIVQGRGRWYATSRLMNMGTRGKFIRTSLIHSLMMLLTSARGGRLGPSRAYSMRCSLSEGGYGGSFRHQATSSGPSVIEGGRRPPCSSVTGTGVLLLTFCLKDWLLGQTHLEADRK